MNSRLNTVQPGQLEYVYKVNFARKLDDLAGYFHRHLMEKLIQRGHHGLKLSFAAVFSNLGFSGARLVDIAERAGMSKQAIGQIADEIEKLGYIRRIPDPSDGRAKNLILTPQGEQLIHHSMEALEEIQGELGQLLGDERVTMFLELLDQLWAPLSSKMP